MDLGVRPQTQVLWDDDIGPETNVDVDNCEQPRDSRPESSQGDVVEASSESDDEEWKYVKGAKDKLNDNDDSKYQLNPNATEFVPVFPNVEKEDFIASSPGIGQTPAKDLDDISVPSETEFDHDISTRACDLEPASELDDMFNSSACHKEEVDVTNKSDGVTLLLSNENFEEKVDTNPFTNTTETNPAKTDSDNVDFVSDYFGKSELDFKPFESVSSHQMVPDKIFESNETTDSHIPNSVSAEISSHFGFIDKHLDSNDILKIDETEKERNHLEIKEPESPIDPENFTNGHVDDTARNDSDKLNIESLQQDDNNEYLVESHFESQIVKDEVLETESHNEEQSDTVHQLIDEFKPTAPVEPTLNMDTNPFGGHESVVEEIKASPVEDMIAEASFDHFEIEKNDVEKPLSPEPSYVNQNTAIENEVVIDCDHSPMEDHLEEENIISEVTNDEVPAQQVDESNLVFHEQHVPVEPVDVINSRLQDLSVSAVCPGTPVALEVDVSQTHINLLANSTQDYDDNHFVNEENKVDTTENNVPHQIDTIGPNAFNFSQPYADDRNESPDFISLRKNNDIMTTSMHESLEQESSFEFISDSAAREAAIAEDNEVVEVDINSENKSEQVNEITDTNEVLKLQNGFDHIESRPDILSSIVESNSAIESESAIVESHEMPISREPDVVFVEQICPSVEVTSEEGSPVGKENGTLETALTAAGIAAAVATAAVATAAVEASDLKKPDAKKEVAKQDTKTTSKPTTKAAPAKKPTTTVKSAPAKPLAAKSAPAKPATTLAAKPKAPISARTATAAAPKPKPATTAAKPLVKAAPAPASARVPAKPSAPSAAARPATGVKLAARPASAPSKTATTAKTSVAPRVPLTAAKKPATTSTLTAKTTTSPRPAAADKPKPAATRTAVTATARTTTAAKTAATAAKPPSKLGLTSSTLSSKPKTTSPTKPLPLKSKYPLVGAKKPTTLPAKKPPTSVLDKNAKNAVKSVPRPPKEIVSEDKKEVNESVTSTTNGHHIENGNISPLDDVSTNII